MLIHNMRIHLLLIAIFLFSSARSVNAEGSAETNKDRPIKIGVLTDLVSKGAYHGKQTLLGAQIAASEINTAGGQLQVVIGDHGMDPTRAVTEVQKQLSLSQVDAVFCNFSGPSRAVSPVVQAANKLFVYTAAAVSPVKENKYAFKSYVDYTAGCEALARIWKKNGLSSVGMLKAESEFGELCEAGVRKVYPELFVTGYKLGDDVASQSLALSKKGIQAVVNVGLEGDMISMLKAFETLKFFPQIGANEDIFTEKVRADFGKLLANAVSFGLPQPDEAFIDRIKQADPKKEITAFDSAGTAYLHVHQIYQALSACKKGDIKCQVDHLAKAQAAAPFGFQGWGPDRQAKFAQSLRKFIDGKFTPIGE